MRELDPTIPLRLALCSPGQDRRVKPGDDSVGSEIEIHSGLKFSATPLMQ